MFSLLHPTPSSETWGRYLRFRAWIQTLLYPGMKVNVAEGAWILESSWRVSSGQKGKGSLNQSSLAKHPLLFALGSALLLKFHRMFLRLAVACLHWASSMDALFFQKNINQTVRNYGYTGHAVESW